MFVTSTVTPDTPPNCLYLPDQDGISDKVIETPSFTVNSNSAQVTFHHRWDMESSDADYDGCVLEISSPNINNGDYTDVLDPAVGGTFATGDYNVVIFVGADNPLSGRRAWGASSPYVTTTLNLGANINGRTIKFRFRMGTDQASANQGWRIDTFAITGASCGP